MSVANTFDLEDIQSVGECAFGELKDGSKVLVLFNRACMTDQEISAARVTLGYNVVNREDMSLAYKAAKELLDHQRRRPQTPPTSGIKEYPHEQGKTLFASDQERNDFLRWYRQFDADRGIQYALDHDERIATACFSPYFAHTREMRNAHIQPPVLPKYESTLGELETRQNNWMRTKLMEEGFWSQLVTLPGIQYEISDCLEAMKRFQPDRFNKGPMVRLVQNQVWSDQITQMMMLSERVDRVYYSMHPDKPWLVASICLVVQPDNWPSFMRDRKCLESRFLAWYCRNRRDCEVELLDSDGSLVAHYPGHEFREDFAKPPLVRIKENRTMFLREEFIYHDALEVLESACPHLAQAFQKLQVNDESQ